MTKSSAAAFVQAAYDRLFAGDLEGFLDCLHPQCVLIEAASLPYGGRHEGRDAIRQAVLQILDLWEIFRFDVAEWLTGDQSVMAYGTLTVSGRKTGLCVSFPLAERWIIADGRVQSINAIYGDTVLAAKAAGCATEA